MLFVCKSINIVSAQSSNSASLPKAFAVTVSASCVSENDLDQSVLRTPGDTQFTTISGLHAFANDLVKWIAAAFEMAVTGKAPLAGHARAAEAGQARPTVSLM